MALKVIAPIFAGASLVLIPLAADTQNQDAPEQQTTLVANRSNAADQAVEILPFIKFEDVNTDLTFYGYARELSKENPTYILSAGSKENFDIAAAHAEEIQRRMKSVYGYDTQVLFIRSIHPDACGLQPYYKGNDFVLEGNRTSMLRAQDALNTWVKFAYFCDEQDQATKKVAAATLER